jgi:hypothetical protein
MNEIQRLNIKHRLIIGPGSAYVIRNGFITAVLDQATPCALVFDNDGYIRAPSWGDLISAAAMLPGQCSDIEAEISSSQVDEGNRVAQYRSDPFELRFCTFDTDVKHVIRHLTKHLNELGMILEFAESGSLEIQRIERVTGCKIDVSSSVTEVAGMPIARWIVRQKQIALRIDSPFSSLGFWNAEPGDPYCLFHRRPRSDRLSYFLQDRDTEAWIWLGDLPRYKRDMMKEMAQVRRKSIRRLQDSLELPRVRRQERSNPR